MRLKQENPHPGKEAKAVTVGGQIYEVSPRVRLGEGEPPIWDGGEDLKLPLGPLCFSAAK